MIAAEPHTFEWIKRGRENVVSPADRNQWQCRVRNIVPPIFQRYAKILHCLEAHYEHIDRPLSDREAEIVGLPDCGSVKTFVEVKRSKGPRFRWKEIADVLEVPFAAEITHGWFAKRLEPNPQCWPRFIWGPAEGNLDVEERDELLAVLKPFSGSQQCYFRFAEMPFAGTEAPILFAGSLEDLQPFLLEGKYQFSPEYWWPEDHSWCVCSDYDLTFTIVGGSASLIDRVLRIEGLETTEANTDTRVDSLVPMPQ